MDRSCQGMAISVTWRYLSAGDLGTKSVAGT
jgi:hypothetical protein